MEVVPQVQNYKGGLQDHLVDHQDQEDPREGHQEGDHLVRMGALTLKVGHQHHMVEQVLLVHQDHLDILVQDKDRDHLGEEDHYSVL